MPLWCGVVGLQGRALQEGSGGGSDHGNIGSLQARKRGPGRGGLGGGRGFQKGEERTPNMLSAAGALLLLDLGARLPAVSPLPLWWVGRTRWLRKFLGEDHEVASQTRTLPLHMLVVLF